MFRKGLLTTTALLAVGSFCFAATQSGAFARSEVSTIASGPGRDANAEFLCQYGGFAVSQSNWTNSSGWFISEWTHVAVRVAGRGQTVSNIIVGEQEVSHSYSAPFFAGIYSAAPDGRPGKLIAGGSGYAPTTCGKVAIPISPTTLTSGAVYWIEESVPSQCGIPNCHRRNEVSWAADRKTIRPALVKTYYVNCGNIRCNPRESHWKKQSTGAYFRLK